MVQCAWNALDIYYYLFFEWPYLEKHKVHFHNNVKIVNSD